MSIAVAGFSGIVFALGRDTASRWTELERVRFRALVSTSLLAFAVAGIALLLLASGVDEARTWHIASGVDAALMSVLLPRRMKALLASIDDPNRRRVTWGFVGVSSAFLALLLLNAVWLGAFWPLGAAVAYHLMGALISFMGLIVPPSEATPAA